MKVSEAKTIGDLQAMAKRRLPRILYDYIEGGVDGEEGLVNNLEAFRTFRFLPRYLRDCSTLDTSRIILGRSYASPFGFGPTGTVGMFKRGGDLMLAEAAAGANIPYIMSGASNSLIEDAARIKRGHFWYQVYPAREDTITVDVIKRAKDAGAEALVITVDVPVNPKRERNLRNGFSHRMPLTPKLVLDGLTHPAWLIEYLRHGGIPVFANWTPYAPAGATPADLIDFFSSQSPCVQVWDDIAKIRDLWPRSLVIKGILHPQDASLAFDAGADGIILSNHGGRQLDRAVAPIDMLAPIRDVVGRDKLVMIDGGLNRGSDIAMALCLGADFCFLGRGAVYGVTAGGTDGAARVIDILTEELGIVMRQLGCPDIASLEPAFVCRTGLPRSSGPVGMLV